MASAAEVLRPEFAVSNLKITIQGKLIEQRKDEDVYYTVLIMAAPDGYSQPKPFEIRSRRSLGNKGEVVTIDCEVGSYYKRAYDLIDKQTGEFLRRVKPIALALDLIEN
jgi:hypothetical protein